jgi:hypothetical protein
MKVFKGGCASRSEADRSVKRRKRASLVAVESRIPQPERRVEANWYGVNGMTFLIKKNLTIVPAAAEYRDHRR